MKRSTALLAAVALSGCAVQQDPPPSGTQVPCAAHADCAAVETAPCEAAWCIEATGACEVVPAVGAPCDDGDPCTLDDTCGAESCEPGEALTCPAPQPCLKDGVCLPSTGACAYEPAGATTACDDGDPATHSDTCDGEGACAGEPIPCEPGPCTPSAVPDGDACVFVHAPAGTPCDDGDPSTATDTCDGAGACAGATLQCPTTTCRLSGTPNGVDCDWTFADAATPCDDGDGLTGPDACDGAGLCLGTPIPCPEPDVPCSDGDPTTRGDTCDGENACVGTPFDCPLAPCIQGATPDGEACGYAFVVAGAPCDDGDPSTTTDTCDGAGACAGQPLLCPLIACHQGTPNGLTCNYQPTPDIPCDDGDALTAPDTCDAAGLCHGLPIACPPSTPCDDGDPTTHSDTCDADQLCQGQPITCPELLQGSCVVAWLPNGTDCTPIHAGLGAWCDDGDPATWSTCDAQGVCQGAPPPCPPLPCQDATYDGVTCSYASAPDDTACDDDDACTQGEHCLSGTCSPTTTTTCPAPAPCHAPGTCDPGTGACSEPPLPDGSPCSDDDLCTAPDTCQSGACAPGAPIDCGPATPCYQPPTCDSATGACTAEPLDDTAPGCCADCVEVCNQLDDDGDGLVDEGFEYVELPGSRYTVTFGGLNSLNDLSRSPDSIGITVTRGSYDVVQVVALDGSPLGAVELTGSGASAPTSLHWIDGAFVLAGQEREYECGGWGSDSCEVYYARVSATGQLLTDRTVAYTAYPRLGGGFLGGGEIVLTHAPGSGFEGPVDARSLTPFGALGSLDAPALFPREPDQGIELRGAADADRMWWLWAEKDTGIRVYTTVLTAQGLTLVHELPGQGLRTASRSGDPILAQEGTAAVLHAEATGGPIFSRWHPDGTAAVAPTLLAEVAGFVSHPTLTAGPGQLYVTWTQDETTRHFARLAPDGTVLQPPINVDGDLAVSGLPLVGTAPTDGGVLIASTDYNKAHLSWAVYGCEPPNDCDGCTIEGTCYPAGPAPDNPCALCDPETPTAWTLLSDLPCGDPDFGTATCDAGSCVLTCVPDRGDCNDDAGDGCETDLLTSAAHCGACDDPCDPGELCANSACAADCGELTLCDGLCVDTTSHPTHCGACDDPCLTSDSAQLGICTTSACASTACPDNTFNLDGHPANGCEYPCIPTGAELCNEQDDDCDGQTDEDYDLTSSTDYCGACDTPCFHPTVQTWSCINSLCIVGECVEGTKNANGFPEDGCEVEWVPEGEIWVEGFFGDDELGDGTEGNPYATIQKGVGAAFEGYVVHVGTGVYLAPVLVDVPGLVIDGASPQAALITADATVPAALTLAASGIVVSGLTITGGRVGVHALGLPESPLLDCELFDLAVSGQHSPAGDQSPAVGVLIEHAVDPMLAALDIISVTAGVADNASNVNATGKNGSEAVGLWLDSVEGGLVQGVTIAGVTAGTAGGYHHDSSGWEGGGVGGMGVGVRLTGSHGLTLEALGVAEVSGGDGGVAPTGRGGPGGESAGLELVDSGQNVVLASTLDTIHGGAGGDGEKRGGTGGLASGIRFAASVGNTVTGCALSGLSGGPGGNAGEPVPSPDQVAFGIFFEPGAEANDISPDNHYEGEPIVYLHSAAGALVQGYTLLAEGNPTNFGKIAIIDSSDVLVADNTIAGGVGRAGSSPSGPGPGEPGRSMHGVYLRGCTHCTVTGNAVAGVVGGEGAPGYPNAKFLFPDGSGGVGGTAALLSLHQCDGGEISFNDLSLATGGEGGDSGDATLGLGGLAAGVYLDETHGMTLLGNTIAAIEGGAGGLAQVGFGLYLEPDALDNDVALSNTLDGLTIVYRRGAANEVIEGLDLSAPGNPTNLGKLVVLESQGVAVSDNTVASFDGARAVSAEDVPDAVGIRIEGCLGCEVSGNEVSAITAGSASDGSPGRAIAVAVTNAPLVEVVHLLVHDLGGLDSVAGSAMVGLRLDSVLQPLVSHITIAHLGGGDLDHTARAVELGPGQGTPVTLQNAIFSDIAGPCLFSDPTNTAGLLAATGSLLHACAGGETDNAALLGDNLFVDPLFADADDGGFHLSSDSPAIDAGLAGTDYCNEPAPNGCSANLGAYGNTPVATSAPTAEHCACQPDPCVEDLDCDDGDACTADTCEVGSGECLHADDPESQACCAGCLVGGACHSEGMDPDNPCQSCDPEVDPQGWTLLSEVPCGEDSVCDAGECVAACDVELGGCATITKYTAITAGDTHFCALRDDQTLWCWGSNSYQQVGYSNFSGNGSGQDIPRIVKGGATYSAVAAGGTMTCAVAAATGAVDCWGTIPTATAPTEGIVGIAAGGTHACGATADGTLYCWGVNDDGQLGQGNFDPYDGPVAVPGLGSVSSVAAANSVTCAIHGPAATVSCWGQDTDGQLGNGDNTSTDVPSPQAVHSDLFGIPLTGASSVAVGHEAGCAAMQDGTLRCWGLGVDHAVDMDLGEAVVAVDLTDTLCAVLESGDVLCQGPNGWGQAGQPPSAEQPTLAVVGLPEAVSSLAVSDRSACALVEGGGVRCWGSNFFGQLGRGTRAAANVGESPAELPGIHDVQEVVLGLATTGTGGGGPYTAASYDVWGHSCGLTLSGDVLCWGGNHKHQCGVNGAELVATPTKIEGPEVVFSALAAAPASTCGVTTGGDILCWGAGTGFPEHPDWPGFRLGDFAAEVMEVTMGSGGWGGQVCARLDDGTVRCPWASAEAIAGVEGATGIGVGSDTGCAVTDTGAVFAWGNLDTELLEAPSVGNGTAVQLMGPDSASSVVCDGETICAGTDDGDVWCWNNAGYGLYDTTSFDVPYQLDYPAPLHDLANYGRFCAWNGDDFLCIDSHWSDEKVYPQLVPSWVLPFDSLAINNRAACGVYGGVLWCTGDTSGGGFGAGLGQLLDHVPAPVVEPCQVTGCSATPPLGCAGYEIEDGGPCNDLDPCTTDDICSGNTCSGGLPVECAPLDECHVGGQCISKALGQCTHPQDFGAPGCSQP